MSLVYCVEDDNDIRALIVYALNYENRKITVFAGEFLDYD